MIKISPSMRKRIIPSVAITTLMLLSLALFIRALVLNKTQTSDFGLIAAIALAVLAFIGMQLIQSRRLGAELKLEKLELNRVIDAVTNLYCQFILIDLENQTYEYLKTDTETRTLPLKGSSEVFFDYWNRHLVNDGTNDTPEQFFSVEGIRALLSRSNTYAQHEYQVTQGGVSRWLQASALPLSQEQGERETCLLAIQDISEMKEQEELGRTMLTEAYQAAEQASRAKSDFLNSMSHDIRTPMNSIMGLTAIATMYIDDQNRVKDCLAKIATSSRHLLGLINEVLDMAKIESGTISLSEEAFDLSETVESLLTIISPQAEAKHQHLKVDIDGLDHEHVIGDPMRLQQVFVNIMGNSVKFTPEGGIIGLSIRELPSQIRGSGRYEFIFSDTGCGMSEEFLARVFEPFARANDSRTSSIEGTGLGMAIVKSVINLMNGTIDAKSQLGKGTTFTIEVYLKLRDTECSDVSELQNLPVLVVDDDSVSCRTAAAMLDEIGMRSDWSLSGEEALIRIREHYDQGTDYVAVILDWKMPGKSGLETAREIRETISADLPIIILSAYDWSAIEQEARSTGVDAFISKPLFRSRLISVLRDVLIDHEEGRESVLENLQRQDFSDYRILLVEDNAIAAEIGQEILGIARAQVEHAENGKAAFELITTMPENYFDLVFMDVQMPLMNGYEATKAIRESGREDLKRIPIIALTADAFNDDVMKAKNAGMNAHMAKPMEIGNLISVLNTWLPC